MSNTLLFEDKIVKFNNEVAPKYGWCVIYIGGPGSGKSTATNFAVNITGKTFDPDAFKQGKIVSLLKIDKNLVTPPAQRRLDNSDYVGELHNATEPIRQKAMQNQLTLGKNYPKDVLPNIIFDIVGSTAKFNEIIPTVKDIGYKVAIVWVLTSVEKAYLQNSKRQRKVADKVVLSGHQKVIDAVENLFASPMLHLIDEFWVIDNLNAATLNFDEDGNVTSDSAYAYQKDTNVYHITLKPNGLQEFKNLIAIIDTNKEFLAKQSTPTE